MALTTLLGMIVGVILALTGAGGGILAVPLLLFGLGISVAEAGPVGLLAVGMAAAVGAGMGLRAGTVRYKAALLMAAAGIACSPMGLWLAHRLPDRPLTLLFALVLLYVAYRVWRRTLPARPGACFKPPPCILDAQRGKLNWTGPCAWALALAGLVAGGLSGLLGVGGGFVMVPALQRYSNLSAQSVLATSLAVIALVSLVGVATSSLAGHVQWAIAGPFCAGALAGMVAGQQVAARLAGPCLQRGFSVVCALVAVGLFIKGLR